ncbi:heavy-metal-associated domain-containing protein [Alkalihalobacterium sp. APHAB7]|uniref:heavy-metal-associated domain-containing protein n=1 Tax=Alkalihalobacterium sp. APHAB7 TaxID=3402081 RepID=UPI003AAAF304
MKHVSLQVEKMSCGNCLSTVENALNGIEGVNRAKASLEDKKVAVEYDETKTEVYDLAEAVRKAGYIVL